MVRMVAKGRRPIHVRGRQINPGETFEASDIDARYYQNRDMADLMTQPVPAAAPTPPPRPQRAPVAPVAPAAQRVPPQPQPPQPAPQPQVAEATGTAKGGVPDDEVAALAAAASGQPAQKTDSDAEYKRRDLRAEG